MEEEPDYDVVPFTIGRRLMAAYCTVARQQNTVHTLIEVDVSAPRRLMREHRQRTGEALSLTAFVVTCLSRAIAEHPHLNAFRRGRDLVLLNDVTIVTMVEREIPGEKVAVPFAIRAASTKTYRQIHDEIRAAQQRVLKEPKGGWRPAWTRFVPDWLLRTYFRLASRSLNSVQRSGVVGVTSTGMFGQGAMWAVILSTSTVAVTVGGIVERPVVSEGHLESHEHLCLTITFNHDIVDGGPATRFLKTFSSLLESSELLRDATEPLETAEGGRIPVDARLAADSTAGRRSQRQ